MIRWRPFASSSQRRASRRTVPRVVWLSLLACAPALAADEVPGAPGYRQAGTGLPAIVLQAGLQDDKASFQRIIPTLARQHLVIAIDRAGHADNPATDAPRDPCTIADEQHRLLQQAGVAPPYILVGHSLGGLYQYVYARRYPGEVAGLVLLDPTHPRHWETMQRDAPAAATMLKLVRTTLFNRVDRAEFDAQAACLDRIDQQQPLTMPVRLLVSGRFRPEERGSVEAMLQRLRQDWLHLLGTDHLQTVTDAGHYIHKDNPQAVLAAIDALGAAAR